MPEQEEPELLTYGHEEGDFHFSQVSRTRPFKRTNHYHQTYEIYYLLSGQRAYFMNDQSYRVAAGDLIFIDQGTVHKSSPLGDHRHERFVINFNDAFLGKDHPFYDSLLLSAFKEPPYLFRLRPQEQFFVRQLLEKIAAEIAGQGPGSILYIRLLLVELLLYGARLKERSLAAAPEPIGTSHRKITEVIRFIHSHYREKLTLTELSASFTISPSYLSRTFRTVTGFNLTEYVNLTRIKEAQRLLKETTHKVIDIAEMVGFDNVGHFNRVFKKMTQSAPLTYRSLNRTQPPHAQKTASH